MWSNTMNSNEIGDHVSKLTDTAGDGVTTATDAVSDLAGKGRSLGSCHCSIRIFPNVI